MALTITAGRSPKAPPRLTHYTTLAGLFGIVENGQLWASNVLFLNDSRELQHGLEATLSALKVFYDDATYLSWHSALTAAARELELGSVIPNTYVTCLSEDADSLSQWRAYGGEVQGIAITFQRAALERALSPKRARLHRVIYGDFSTTKKMTAALKRELATLDEMEDLIGSSTESEKERAALNMMCGLLPQFKHWGFHDEREYRFIIQHDTLTDEVCFRVQRNVLVPYVKLGSASSKLPIKVITIGPGKDQALTERSVRIYLDRHGYSGVEIKTSAVPFRT
jgi:hypothetical protein